MNFEALFPKEEQHIAKLAKLVNEQALMRLVTLNKETSEATKIWGGALEKAFSLQKKVNFFRRAKQSGFVFASQEQVIETEIYDLQEGQEHLDSAKKELLLSTSSINNLAAKYKLPPLLPTLNNMEPSQAVECLFAYYEAFQRRGNLGKANAT